MRLLLFNSFHCIDFNFLFVAVCRAHSHQNVPQSSLFLFCVVKCLIVVFYVHVRQRKVRCHLMLRDALLYPGLSPNLLECKSILRLDCQEALYDSDGINGKERWNLIVAF